eukprot:g20782.t1
MEDKAQQERLRQLNNAAWEAAAAQERERERHRQLKQTDSKKAAKKKAARKSLSIFPSRSYSDLSPSRGSSSPAPNPGKRSSLSRPSLSKLFSSYAPATPSSVASPPGAGSPAAVTPASPLIVQAQLSPSATPPASSSKLTTSTSQPLVAGLSDVDQNSILEDNIDRSRRRNIEVANSPEPVDDEEEEEGETPQEFNARKLAAEKVFMQKLAEKAEQGDKDAEERLRKLRAEHVLRQKAQGTGEEARRAAELLQSLVQKKHTGMRTETKVTPNILKRSLSRGELSSLSINTRPRSA